MKAKKAACFLTNAEANNWCVAIELLGGGELHGFVDLFDGEVARIGSDLIPIEDIGWIGLWLS